MTNADAGELEKLLSLVKPISSGLAKISACDFPKIVEARLDNNQSAA